MGRTEGNHGASNDEELNFLCVQLLAAIAVNLLCKQLSGDAFVSEALQGKMHPKSHDGNGQKILQNC